MLKLINPRPGLGLPVKPTRSRKSGGDKPQSVVQRISLREVSMAKVNATTNGREKIITFI